MQSIMIGITNLTFTMLGMFLIDKVGRKKLIGVGAVGMFVSLVLVARGFWLERFEGYYMLVCLMGYIAFFAVSLGATIWVVISEVFPNSVRAKGAGAGQHDPGCGRRCCRGSSLSSFRLAAFAISSDFSRLLPSAALSLR